jgi:hypothetical protein
LTKRLPTGSARRLPAEETPRDEDDGRSLLHGGGHRAIGIVGDELMVRVGPDGYERALARAHAREMDFTGRPMRGFIFVEPGGIRTKRSLGSWVTQAAAFATSFAPRPAKRGRGNASDKCVFTECAPRSAE